MARPLGSPQMGGHHPTTRYVLQDLKTGLYFKSRMRRRRHEITVAPTETVWTPLLQVAQVFLGKSSGTNTGLRYGVDPTDINLVEVALVEC